MSVAWCLVADPHRSFVEACHSEATMKNPHEAKLHEALASSYQTEVEPLAGGWVATVYIVTKTTRLEIYKIASADETSARNNAYEFLRDRPR